jgi:hypothetical protein
MKTPVWLAYANRADRRNEEIEQWQQQFMNRWFANWPEAKVRPDLGPV